MSKNVIENYTIQSGTHDFLLTFHIVTIGLSRTVSEINGDVRRKSNENRQFSNPPPVYLTPPMKEFPVEIGIGVRGRKCLNDGPIRRYRKVFG